MWKPLRMMVFIQPKKFSKCLESPWKYPVSYTHLDVYKRQVYIPDIYIGDVKDVVKTTDASTLRIIVEPAVVFTKINRVYVLTK